MSGADRWRQTEITLRARPRGFHLVTEGGDEMPAHIKSSVFGCELTIPILATIRGEGP